MTTPTMTPEELQKAIDDMPAHRPETPTWNISRHDMVWLLRERSAWDMADMTGGATIKRVADAASLLDRIQRFAMADARQAEAEENPCNYKTDGKPRDFLARKADQLARRRDRLQRELSDYSGGQLVMRWFGAYPTICNADNTRSYYFLHYFD